jgi:vacuolar-type H+-ATPase subunit I/STV1
MKKHLRWYKCQETQCKELLGFMYSGDLSRHKREAHNKDGIPKKILKCTVDECERGEPGREFRRKENLKEHLRRVHGITPTSGSQLQTIGSVATELAETLSPDLLAIGDADESSTATTSVHSQRIDLESELQKLKANNLERDKRISQLEERGVSMEARLEYLEHELERLTKQNA